MASSAQLRQNKVAAPAVRAAARASCPSPARACEIADLLVRMSRPPGPNTCLGSNLGSNLSATQRNSAARKSTTAGLVN